MGNLVGVVGAKKAAKSIKRGQGKKRSSKKKTGRTPKPWDVAPKPKKAQSNHEERFAELNFEYSLESSCCKKY